MGDTLFDKYSLLHFGSGVVAFLLGVPKMWWFFFHIVFELVENSPRGIEFISTTLSWWPGGKTRPDDWINIVGDNISAFAGWLIAENFRR